MLIRCLLVPVAGLLVLAAQASAQDMVPHRAVYEVGAIENGKPTGGSPGTYAYELKLTCDGYVIYQRLRLETAGQRSTVVSEQQTQMTESRDGRKLTFEHRSVTGGKQTSLMKCEATISDDGTGEARFSDPPNQTVALPAGTMFPVAIARATIRAAKAGETSLDARFFFDKRRHRDDFQHCAMLRCRNGLKQFVVRALEVFDHSLNDQFRRRFLVEEIRVRHQKAFQRCRREPE